MENLRKRINVRLINNAKDYVKCVSKPTFVSQKIFSKNLVAIHKIKPVLVLNKPIYVGFSILELSKLLMYDFHYGYFKNKFNSRLSKLLMYDFHYGYFKNKFNSRLSKLLMYDFHYGYFKNKFNSRLLFTDTDSLVYEIKDKDYIYEKIYSDRDLFDFSDYSKNSKFYDVTNKKVIGKMKNEFGGKVISEFIGLKPKVY